MHSLLLLLFLSLCCAVAEQAELQHSVQSALTNTDLQWMEHKERERKGSGTSPIPFLKDKHIKL